MLDFISLLETKKERRISLKQSFMACVEEGISFGTELHGRSGGILLGVNLDELEVGSTVHGYFFYQVQLKEQK